jgi:hypothetical protein
MSRLENLSGQFADLMNQARNTLTWQQKQRLMAAIDQRLELERDRDDAPEDQAA